MAEVELTTAAAARRLGVDPRTLKRWTDEGKIACRLSWGGRRLYAVSDIDYLSARLKEGR